MHGLRSKFGGPKFDVHLTVVGPINLTKEDALEKFEAACLGLNAYPAHAKEVSSGNSFWQSVFLRLDPTSQVILIYLRRFFNATLHFSHLLRHVFILL
ncbi:Cyclic phosphodiesterase [Bienertia sinuspersici]